jgi:hypothetical protein
MRFSSFDSLTGRFVTEMRRLDRGRASGYFASSFIPRVRRRLRTTSMRVLFRFWQVCEMATTPDESLLVAPEAYVLSTVIDGAG